MYLTRSYVKKTRKLEKTNAALSVVQNEMNVRNEAHNTVARCVAGIISERTGLTDHFTAIYTHQSSDRRELQQRFYRFLTLVLSNTREMFGAYTTNSCAVCIKLFVEHDPFVALEESAEDGPAQLIKTLLRDDVSSPTRRIADSDGMPYEYHKNAAFWSIIDDPRSDNYYFANDLESLGNQYWNANTNWKNYYTATAVVPIKKPGSTAKANTIGFLCVDNLGGGFDESYTRFTLDIMSNMLYYTLSSTYFVMRSPS